MEDLRYPIGKYQPVEAVTQAYIDACIEEIASLPALMRNAVAGLSDAQLNTPYRVGGWTVRQVVHHVGDSHLNSIIRFKWTITEDKPTIKTYDEKAWAETPEIAAMPVGLSLDFLDVLHKKWTALLSSFPSAAWSRTFVHPEMKRELSLGWLIGLYAWHGKHHVGHISSLKAREGWD